MSFLINPYAFLAAGGDFESIATVTVGSGGAATVVFDNIPGTFQHLELRYVARSTRSADGDNPSLFYNTDTNSANYVFYHFLYGNGSIVGTGVQTSGVSASNLLPTVPASNITSNIFGANVCRILDYSNTSKNKTVFSTGGLDTNGGGQVDLMSGLWMSTNAITKVTIGCTNGFAQHSTFALYGVKAP